MHARRRPATLTLVVLAALLVLAKLGLTALLVGGDPAPPLCRWDCNWYSAIARFGYRPGPVTVEGRLQYPWPFFPLMPLLMRAASGLTALDLPHAGMLVSSLCLIGMALVGVRYRQATRNAQRPSTWLVLCAAMPFGLYFDTGYSESAYGLLSLATLLGLARRSPLAASLPSALLSAARPTGVWLAPAIGLASLRRARHAPSAAALLLALLPGLIAVLGLLAWMFYLAVAAGDPIAFVHAEAGWGRHPANPVATLARSLSYLLPRRHHLQEGWQGAWALIGLAVSSWLAWSRRWTEACFLGVTVVLALSTGNGASMCRFVGASPVFLLALADLIDRAGRPARIAVLIACAGLQALFDLLWIDGWHWLV